MTLSLRIRSQAQEVFNRAVSSAWRSTRIWDPSSWLLREPDAPEKIRKDPDIARVLDYRDQLVAGRQWRLTPSDEEDPMADLAVKVGTQLVKTCKQFTEARLHLASASFYGQAFERIHTEPRPMNLGDGRLRTWATLDHLEFMDKRFYRRVPIWEKGELLGAKWERWHVGADKWVEETDLDGQHTIEHTYKGSHNNLGHGQALLEPLGWLWYTKQHVWSEGIQAVERFAQGTLKVAIDGMRDAAAADTNAQVIQDYLDELEDMRARHVLAHDGSDEIEMLSGNAEGWQLITEIEQTLVKKIDRLVLGSILPTGGGDEGAGSLARAGVEEDSTESLVQFDREALEETLSDDLIGCLWQKNYPNLVELGIWESQPKFNIHHEKKEDPKEVAEVANILHGAGFALSAADVYERTGFKQPEPGEEIIEGATAPAPMPGFGGGFGQPPQQPQDQFGAGVFQ